jgi:hypothetical protein
VQPAPGTALEDPEDDQTQSDGREKRTDNVELRRVLWPWRRLHTRAHNEDQEDDHDLADEYESPGVIRCHPTTDDRADRDGSSGDAADDPIRERTLLPLIVGRDQGGDSRDDEHGAQPFDKRPGHEEYAEVWAQSSRQRPEAVDSKTDTKRPIASPDIAELRPYQHERRHH